MLPPMEFLELRDRIRLELYAQFTTWTDLLNEGLNPSEDAEVLLSELWKMRNNSSSLPVDHRYFDTGIGYLKRLDIAKAVLEGARSEVNWFGVVENFGDLEARFKWVCEQEMATVARASASNRKENKKLESKICKLKGRFLVIWSALQRFKSF